MTRRRTRTKHEITATIEAAAATDAAEVIFEPDGRVIVRFTKAAGPGGAGLTLVGSRKNPASFDGDANSRDRCDPESGPKSDPWAGAA